MKQTKPYGRAFNPSDTEAPSRARNPVAPPPERKPAPPKPSEESSDAFVLDVDSSAFQPAAHRSRFIPLLTRLALALVVVVACIGLRDSLLIQNIVTMVSTKETVMICAQGEVQYAGWNVWDRLVGNGQFVCTEWRVQTRFVNIPRF